MQELRTSGDATRDIPTRIPASRVFTAARRKQSLLVFTAIESWPAVHRAVHGGRSVGISGLLFDILTVRTRGYLIKPTVQNEARRSECLPACQPAGRAPFLTPTLLAVSRRFNILRRGEYTSVCITLRGNASDPYADIHQGCLTRTLFPLSPVIDARKTSRLKLMRRTHIVVFSGWRDIRTPR